MTAGGPEEPVRQKYMLPDQRGQERNYLGKYHQDYDTEQVRGQEISGAFEDILDGTFRDMPATTYVVAPTGGVTAPKVVMTVKVTPNQRGS